MNSQRPILNTMTDAPEGPACYNGASSESRRGAMDLLDSADMILCDLDGCLIQDGRGIPGAAALVQRYRNKFKILTNNSTDTPQSLSDKLAGYGIDIAPEQIVLAGAAAVELIARTHPGARLMPLATGPIREYAESLGLTCIDPMDSDPDPDLVLLCRDTDVHFDKLQNAIRLVGGGVPYYAANPDITHPGKGGSPVIETGLILNFVQQATNLKPRAVIGKPEAELYIAALGGLAPEAAVMIGDNPLTDMKGAAAINMPGIRISPNFQISDLL